MKEWSVIAAAVLPFVHVLPLRYMADTRLYPMDNTMSCIRRSNLEN